MGMGAFSVGQRFSLAGAAMRFTRKIEGDQWIMEDLNTGRFIEHSQLALLDAWNSGQLTFLQRSIAARSDVEVKDLLDGYGDAFRQTFPPEAWTRARMKLEFVLRLQRAPITKPTLLMLIEEIWKDDAVWQKVDRPSKMPGWTTVHDWLRRYKDAGRDVRALIDRVHERGNRKERYCEEVMEIVDDLIDTLYLTKERPTKASVLEAIRGRIAKENTTRPPSQALLKPTKSTLTSRISELDPFDIYAARYGVPAARIKFRASYENVQALKPLSRVLIDHYRMNMFVVDEEVGLPLGRPWLTLLLDECTRQVVGYYLGFEEPSNVSVARAIRHAIAPKDLADAGVDLVNVWDVWGVMETIVADNGLELHGETMEQGCSRYGIRIQYCPRKKPWYKGKIERFFRTIDQGLTSTIPGKTFENIFKRGDYDPSKHAVVRLSTLRKVILKWIVDYYHQAEHRSLGMSPAQAWQEEIDKVDRYLPTSSVLLEAAFSKSITRKLDKDGIEFDSLFYQSEDLRRVRESFGSEINVECRVMDDDLGWIMVVAPHSRVVLRVPAVRQEYASGMTRWQHTICKRYKRLRFKRDGVDLELYEAKNMIRELIAHDTDLVKRSSRARQKRFAGDESLVAKKTEPEVPAVVEAKGLESPTSLNEQITEAAFVVPVSTAVPKYRAVISEPTPTNDRQEFAR